MLIQVVFMDCIHERIKGTPTVSQHTNFHLLSKSLFSPPLLNTGKSDRAETFFSHTRRYLGWLFVLVSKNIALMIFSSFYEISSSIQISVF
jgi:hypothetical protein